MPKEKVNYQEVDDLYQLCSETKDLKEFCSEYGVNYDSHLKIQPSSFRLRRVSGSTASIQRHTLRGSSSA